MESLGINPGYLIVQILNFAIIMVILRAWVIIPIMAMLDKRSKTIAQGLEDAQIAANARSNAEKEANRIISEAKMKASEITKEATRRAEEIGHEVKLKAEEDIARERDIVQEEMAQEKSLMLSELRDQVADLAVTAAHRLIGESIIKDKVKQRELIDQLFSGIHDGKVQVIDDYDLSGTTVDVISALPLSDEEEQKIKQELQKIIGGECNINFQVDPSILGGLVIKAGDRVIDGSIASQLKSMQKSIK